MPTVETEEADALAQRGAGEALPARVAALAGSLRASYDARPVSRAEWDDACGDVG